MPIDDSEITRPIIGAAIRVHRELGPGFLESVYESALAIELHSSGIAFERQVSIPVMYRGVEVGTHRLDLVVQRTVIAELKASRDVLETHFSVVRSYVRAYGGKHAVIFNFSKPKLEVHRVFAEHARRPPPSARTPART